MGGGIPSCYVLLVVVVLSVLCVSNACPDGCQCTEPRSVGCVRLDAFPSPDKIPDGTAEIKITNSQIDKIKSLPDYGSDIENFILVNSGVTEIEDGAFSHLTGLKNLMLNGNKIMEITAAKFAGLKNLVELDLGDNLIKVLPNGLLNNLTSLLKLDLNSNKMLRLQADCFEGSSIVDLDVGNCDLGMVDSGIFAKASNLVDLNLIHNPLLKLTKDSFRGMGKLQNLYVANCGLTEVDKDAFEDLKQLQSLDLSFNQLTELDEDILSNSEGTLKTLRLNHNNLTTLDHHFGKIELLTVCDNPWDCTCKIGWMKDISIEEDHEAICSMPEEVSGHGVRNVTSQMECLCGYEDCSDQSHLALYIAIPVVIILVLFICFFIYMIIKNRREKAKRKSVKYSAVYKDTVEAANKPV